MLDINIICEQVPKSITDEDAESSERWLTGMVEIEQPIEYYFVCQGTMDKW